MSLSYGENLGLLVDAALGEQAYSALMIAWRGFDGLIQPCVASMTVSAQPGSPTDGLMHIVPAGATGASWSTHTNKVTRYSTKVAAWEYYTPKEGWEFSVVDSGWRVRFTGTVFLFVQGGGTAGNRPSSAVLGATYFNTDTGLPNFWAGAGWVDATGASV